MLPHTFAALCGLVALALPAAAQTIYNAGVFPGGTLSQMRAINADATVAAGYSGTSSGARALRWIYPGGSSNLGLLPGGINFSEAHAVSADGTVIAGYGDIAGGPPRAFRWTVGAGYEVLPLASGATIGEARSVSGNGSVIVGRISGGALGVANRPFRWTAAGGGVGTTVDLGVLSGDESAAANAVSADGATIVGLSGSRAFRWISGPGMQPLPALPTQVHAEATAVNADGTVIVGVWRDTATVQRIFRYTAAGIEDLGTFSGPVSSIRPTSVSADGRIIVGNVDTGSAFLTFIWSPLLGVQDLQTHMALRDLPTPAWQLSQCTGVNAEATAFCGVGTTAGQSVGWVARGMTCADVLGAIGGGPVCLGMTYTMQFDAFGQGIVYNWTRAGQPLQNGPTGTGSIIDGVPGPKVTISNFGPSDTGRYSCDILATPSCGGASYLANAWAVIAPVIFLGPYPSTVCAGTNPTMTTYAGAYSGLPVFRWQRHIPPFPNTFADIFDGPTGNGSAYAGTGTETLTITNAQPADSERYRCIVTDSDCPGEASSQSYAVTLSAQVTVNPWHSIATQPANATICAGQTATYAVVMNGSTSGLTFQWYHCPPEMTCHALSDGFNLDGLVISGSQSPTLSIQNTHAYMQGAYYCIITGPCGEVVTDNALLTFTTGTPTTILNPVNQTICPRGTAIMTSAATGNGTLTYQWQRETAPSSGVYTNLANGTTNTWDGAAPGLGGVVSGATTTAMTISWNPGSAKHLAPIHTRRYRCVASNQCGGTPSAPMLLTICMGDFNCDGVVTTQDLYDYLADWNSQAYNGPVLLASADMNHDGVVTVQDIYDFMAFWNAGCPS